MEDDGFILVRGREAGERENVGDERAGVVLIGVAVRVMDVHGDLWELEQIGHGVGPGLRAVDEREGVRGWDGRLSGHFWHAAGFVGLSGKSKGREQESGGEEELHSS
jgi:hypothetical protein